MSSPTLAHAPSIAPLPRARSCTCARNDLVRKSTGHHGEPGEHGVQPKGSPLAPAAAVALASRFAVASPSPARGVVAFAIAPLRAA